MCGIAGIIGHSNEQQLMEMLHTQRHRGPDNIGVWEDEGVYLGHNRLSIIDLSAAANQPMTDASGRYMMVFNGEIYNYRELKNTWLQDQALSTSSDSEVLLAMYEKLGAGMLNELIGMFAFAIWDKQEKTLFAARDRFGVKPFYYSTGSHAFYFASEIPTLWAAGIIRAPRTDVWAGYFVAGTYGKPADTFWKDIFQLPAGHCLEYSSDRGHKIQQWYHFVSAVEQQPVFEKGEDLHSAYLYLLQEAVSLRFRADVPVGFTLSGGLDSSLLLAAIHHLYPGNTDIKAFTFYSGNKEYDELPWAERLAAHTLKPIERVKLDHNDIPADARYMSRLQAEPYGAFPTIAYSKIFKRAAQQGFKVLLDGQGMDEAWAGYDYYFSGSGHLVQGSVSSPVHAAAITPEFSRQQQETIHDTPFDNPLQNLQYRDLFFTKLPRALRFNDRASMMSSVELREPFLDHRLVELAFAQPAKHKLRNGQPKWMLRKIAEEWLGNDIAFAPKRPVQTPQREWLRHEVKDWAQEQIGWLSAIGNPGWFDGKAMQQGWNNFRDGKGDNSFFVWQWINTALLLREG